MAGTRRISLTLVAASALSLGAGLIHVRAALGHAEESALYAVLFATLAAWQFAWAAAVLWHSSRRLLYAGALVSVSVVAVWVLSRTAGLPVGPEHWRPEAIGVPDAVTTLDELMLVVLVGWCLWPRRAPLLRSLAPSAVDAGALALAFASAVVFVAIPRVG